MAIELFQPFVIHRLIRQNIVNNIKAAKKLINRADDEVMQVLQEVIEGHPILLNDDNNQFVQSSLKAMKKDEAKS